VSVRSLQLRAGSGLGRSNERRRRDGAGVGAAQVGKASGCLEAWEVGGRPLLAEPVKPSFFRAPTDNDLGGSNNISFAVRCAAPAAPGRRPRPLPRRPGAYWAERCLLPCTALHLLVPCCGQRAPRLSVGCWLLAVLAQYEAHGPKVRRKPGRIWERAPERLRRGAGRAWAGARLAACLCDFQGCQNPAMRAGGRRRAWTAWTSSQARARWPRPRSAAAPCAWRRLGA